MEQEELLTLSSSRGRHRPRRSKMKRKPSGRSSSSNDKFKDNDMVMLGGKGSSSATATITSISTRSDNNYNRNNIEPSAFSSRRRLGHSSERTRNKYISVLADASTEWLMVNNNNIVNEERCSSAHVRRGTSDGDDVANFMASNYSQGGEGGGRPSMAQSTHGRIRTSFSVFDNNNNNNDEINNEKQPKLSTSEVESQQLHSHTSSIHGPTTTTFSDNNNNNSNINNEKQPELSTSEPGRQRRSYASSTHARRTTAFSAGMFLDQSENNNGNRLSKSEHVHRKINNKNNQFNVISSTTTNNEQHVSLSNTIVVGRRPSRMKRRDDNINNNVIGEQQQKEPIGDGNEKSIKVETPNGMNHTNAMLSKSTRRTRRSSIEEIMDIEDESLDAPSNGRALKSSHARIRMRGSYVSASMNENDKDENNLSMSSTRQSNSRRIQRRRNRTRSFDSNDEDMRISSSSRRGYLSSSSGRKMRRQERRGSDDASSLSDDPFLSNISSSTNERRQRRPRDNRRTMRRRDREEGEVALPINDNDDRDLNKSSKRRSRSMEHTSRSNRKEYRSRSKSSNNKKKSKSSGPKAEEKHSSNAAEQKYGNGGGDDTSGGNGRREKSSSKEKKLTSDKNHRTKVSKNTSAQLDLKQIDVGKLAKSLICNVYVLGVVLVGIGIVIGFVIAIATMGGNNNNNKQLPPSENNDSKDDDYFQNDDNSNNNNGNDDYVTSSPDKDPYEGIATNDASSVKWYPGKLKEGLRLEVLNALDETYQDIFNTVMDEWDNPPTNSIGQNMFPDALTLTIKKVPVEPDCEPVLGKLKVCNNDDGPTGYRGINKWVSKHGWIVSSVSKMNDYYLRNAKNGVIQYTMCHECGHAWGLGHTDEDFTNADLGNCLDYTRNLGDNKSPDGSNYKMLSKMYGTVPEDDSPVTSNYANNSNNRSRLRKRKYLRRRHRNRSLQRFRSHDEEEDGCNRVNSLDENINLMETFKELQADFEEELQYYHHQRPEWFSTNNIFASNKRTSEKHQFVLTQKSENSEEFTYDMGCGVQVRFHLLLA